MLIGKSSVHGTYAGPISFLQVHLADWNVFVHSSLLTESSVISVYTWGAGDLKWPYLRS